MLSIAATTSSPFLPTWNTPGYALRPFPSEILLTLTLLSVLIAPFFAKKPNLAAGAISLAGLLFAISSLFILGPTDPGLHFRGLLLSDHVSLFWRATLLIFTAAVVLLWFATS